MYSLAIALAIIAQFIYAVVALVDKYIVSTKKVPAPSYYAFFLSLLSALSVFVFFFSFIELPIPELRIPSFAHVYFPTMGVLILSFLSGVALFFSLWSLFTAFRDADASDVIPVVGSVSALIAFPLSHFLLGVSIPEDFMVGIILLVLGSLLLSHYRFKWRVFFIAIISGVFFATHFVLLKYLFNITSFDNAFFWSRVGIVVAALVIFLPRWSYCKDCFQQTAKQSAVLILGNKIMAGVASFIVLKAIDLSDVGLIQALGGLQFVFLFILSITIGRFLPKECGEGVSGRYKVQKGIAIALLVIGLIFLFL